MSLWIFSYLFLGACFGLVTHSRRHLFSEGPARPTGPGKGNLMEGRVVWALICSCLWPLMALTGLLSFWRLSRVKARSGGGERR